MSFRHSLGRLGCALALLVAGATLTGGTGTAESADTVRTSRGAGAAARSVTLLTGDRVTVRAGRSDLVDVVPGAGRSGMRHTVLRTGGHVHVIPDDAVSLLDKGKLDRRLFDVTALLRAGHDDARRDDVPLIVRHAGTRGRAALSRMHVLVGRPLPAIGGSAARVAKHDASRAWSRLRTAKDLDRIWLDGRRKVSLDRSVSQVGAPAAWARGLTGAGVGVAVLDTGIDATHPDLAGRVVASEDFTGEGTDDGFGHGTHVASIVAGTGAAADGRYRGVAPAANLMNGKVCDSTGWCEESWILAGMAWAAVEQRAKVINLSLGSQDTPGIDPTEEAVNTLTAQTGALFVVSAGNADSSPHCRVGSPASADAALAVGAVDDDDALAWFSCTGPRVGDEAMKPDITAPGVDIVAARAANGQAGKPGDDYVSLSGTSMAAPHVAGAAAILAQQHPDWSAAELKANLMGTAESNPKLTAFQQGAGRLAVDRAVESTLIAEPAALSFGTQLWPHADDAPVSRPLTYQNLGDEAVTVRLSAELTGPDGEPAPSGAIRVSPTSLTIPAGGRAEVVVTADTRHGGPDGVYSGHVTATAGEQTIGTAVGVDKEVESYELTVDHLDATGRPAPARGFLYGLDTDVDEVFETDGGNWRLRLPKGRYVLHSSIAHQGGERSVYLLHRPLVELDHDLTLVQDARAAKPVSIRTQRPGTAVLPLSVNVHRQGSGGRTFGLTSLLFPGDPVYTAQLGPAAPSDEMITWMDVQGGVRAPDGWFGNSPVVYALVFTRKGQYFDGADRVVRDQDLIPVVHRGAVQLDGQQFVHRFAGTPAGFAGGWFSFTYDRPPTKVTVFHTPDPAVRWTSTFLQGTTQSDGFVENTWLQSPERTYAPGRRYHERWNVAAFAPSLTPVLGAPGSIVRNGDEIHVGLQLFSDGAGHNGGSIVDEGWRTRLLRDGEPVAEQSAVYPGAGVFTVPATPGRYRLEVSTTRERVGVSELSTRVDAAWTFNSSHVPAGDPEDPASWHHIPAWVANFSPRVDDRNRSHEGTVQHVPVTVTPNPGADVGQLRKIHVESSTDDGATWQRALVLPADRGRHVAIVVTPQDASVVSLRTKTTDSHGNTYQATIIRAYGLAPS